MSGEEQTSPQMPGGKDSPGSGTGDRREKAGNELMTGLRLIILVLVFIAAMQLYFSIQGVIGMWISYQFIPLINAIYYLAVIVGGIWILRGVLSHR